MEAARTSRGGSRRCPLPPSDPTVTRSPLPLAVAPSPRPRHSARPSPDGRAPAPQVPGNGALGRREEDGAAEEGLTSALPAVAGAGPGGARARPAHPPAAGLSWAPSSPALRPRVPKLLNLRAAHALRGQRPTRRIGPLGRLGPALALRNAPLRRSAPRSPPRAGALRRASALPEFPARRGASPPLARGRESPPFAVPPPRAGPPCRDPQQKTDWSARPGSP